jgi:DNA-binding response OmpR family regulator
VIKKTTNLKDRLNSENKKIFLVDDERDIALAFSLGLQSNGFLVNIFTNSKEALSNFKANVYKLALLDIKMPEMDGIELAEKLREIDNKIKICFITAFDLDYQTINKYSYCIIKKPISIEDLIRKIKMEMD